MKLVYKLLIIDYDIQFKEYPFNYILTEHIMLYYIYNSEIF